MCGPSHSPSTGSYNVLFCAPVALEARHLAYNKPQFPTAACLLLLPSSLWRCLKLAWLPLLLAGDCPVHPAWACPTLLLRQTSPGVLVLAIPYLSLAHRLATEYWAGTFQDLTGCSLLTSITQ